MRGGVGGWGRGGGEVEGRGKLGMVGLGEGDIFAKRLPWRGAAAKIEI